MISIDGDKYDALRDLVSSVQFKKHEKHPWWSVTFSNTVSNISNCANGTKSRKTSQIVYDLTSKT